jgi:hypothetical protein
MSTTRDDIRGWLERAKKEGATHMLIICDTYDWEDYPVNVPPHKKVADVYKQYNGLNMQKVMEVYALHLDIEAQLKERRAYHLEDKPDDTQRKDQ